MASTSSESHDNARQTLVDRLLDAVKQCQIRFGGKTELATDSDSRVSCLCAQWEAALQYGIKSNRKLNPLRHVAGQVLLKPEVLWQFLKQHLSATEILRFNSLQNISTDAGKARAWLRSALNEQSLEKYLHSFLGYRQVLSSYFEQEALLMEEERSSMLPMMAAGLSSILFAINIDNSEFNASKQISFSIGLGVQLAPVNLIPEPAKYTPSPAFPDVQGKEKKKRRKKKTNVTVASIENVDFEQNSGPEETEIANDRENREENAVNNLIGFGCTKPTNDISSISMNQVNDLTCQKTYVSTERKSEENRSDFDTSLHAGSKVKDQKEYGVLQNEADTNADEFFGITTQDENTHGTSLWSTPSEEPLSYLPFDPINDKIQNAINNSSELKEPQIGCLNLQFVKKDPVSHKDDTAAGQSAEDEPLVELNSGVSLTPVSCPDEEKLWALQELDDSESPYNDDVLDSSFLVTSKLFGGSMRDSPVSSGFTTDDDVSEDANLAIDATEAALLAVQDVQKEMADFTRFTVIRTMGDGRNSPPKETANPKEMTSGELKQAIVSMMLRKDEVEECNRSLRDLLDKEMVESASLRLQVEELNKDKASSYEAHHATVQILSSENDLLKHQLKKYVAAVQSLRRNESIDIAVPGQNDDLPVPPERNTLSNSDNNGMEDEFERKLIQVADMHGELIELNERLQKMLSIREHQLRRIREELVNLRGPLPGDASQDDSFSLDEFGPRLVPVNTRPLINIWIPSAFAQGKSSTVHHTYQVYVRIKDDEWNVYRRYSQFHDMHKKISKLYPAIGNFKFPQKKVIGNRDTRFVEARRRHLQNYLRKLINYGIKCIPELSENPSKSTLVKCFPFFSNSPKEDKVSTPENIAQTHYTGL